MNNTEVELTFMGTPINQLDADLLDFAEDYARANGPDSPFAWVTVSGDDFVRALKKRRGEINTRGGG